MRDLLRQPRFAEAAKKLFLVEPPKPRPTLAEMREDIARITVRSVPQAPPAQRAAEPTESVESIRDRVIANHALPQELPTGMEELA